MTLDEKKRTVFVFDMARHRSHLFFRYMSTHPDLEPVYHPYMDAFAFGPERITKWTNNSAARKKDLETEVSTSTYARAEADLLRRAREADEKGRTLLANEHCQMIVKQDLVFSIIRDPSPLPFPANPTVIPDSLFDSILPIFVIRNPLQVIPSIYASSIATMALSPSDEDWKILTGILTQRLLFDHFQNDLNRVPVVVDGDDLLWRTEEVRRGLSAALDIDPAGLSDTWEPLPEELQHPNPLIRAFTTTINTSKGIEQPSGGPPPELDLDDAESQWSVLYGDDIARQLRERIEENMPHYLHMRQFKV
ncbi:hypothetical protein M409DRAFT_30414 [Zasmidium cellare ATCC 36951]|uniref:Sulfotransferase domain-containing protein n=1 Tax=Zasmidium cellare ATCC 36951 TaxID=1080233 RepID=A0A6A6BZW7_ZASCE|nr:uncharacterized protein M409DRAFT_30414 [Zasmidium cellare ATCC 36951]KAF2159132.1 hypothetical protein M409DRAFT_30414 [Zasmidium cellare ATCC 36951]